MQSPLLQAVPLKSILDHMARWNDHIRSSRSSVTFSDLRPTMSCNNSDKWSPEGEFVPAVLPLESAFSLQKNFWTHVQLIECINFVNMSTSILKCVSWDLCFLETKMKKFSGGSGWILTNPCVRIHSRFSNIVSWPHNLSHTSSTGRKEFKRHSFKIGIEKAFIASHRLHRVVQNLVRKANGYYVPWFEWSFWKTILDM